MKGNIKDEKNGCVREDSQKQKYRAVGDQSSVKKFEREGAKKARRVKLTLTSCDGA